MSIKFLSVLNLKKLQLAILLVLKRAFKKVPKKADRSKERLKERTEFWKFSADLSERTTLKIALK